MSIVCCSSPIPLPDYPFRMTLNYLFGTSEPRTHFLYGSEIFGLGYGAFKLNEGTYPWLEQAFGLPIDEFMQLGAQLNRFFLELADEARQLLDVL